MNSAALHYQRRFIAASIILLLALTLVACDSGRNPPAGSGNGYVPASSASIQLGAQPCPNGVKDPTHWNAIVRLAADQMVESVTCGNLIGTTELQAVVIVRHAGSDRVLDVSLYNDITNSHPTLMFALDGLLHGDAKISGYSTLLTGQADPHSSLNKGLPRTELEQDLYREFKWSDSARTFVPVTFQGIFPDLTRFQAEIAQQEVNVGQGSQQWRLDVVKSAQNFVNSFLNWSADSPATILSGGGSRDYKAVVQVQGNSTSGGKIRIAFSRLEGNNNGGIWEATAITSDGLTLTSPQSMQHLTSPVTVAGTEKAYQGKRMILKVLDHFYSDIGHITVAASSVNGQGNFSASVPYTSSFQSGTQEGIIALYVYNGDSSVAAVVMEKVLLSA